MSLNLRKLECIPYYFMRVQRYSNVKSTRATGSNNTNKFVDKVRIYVRGGSGGQGCPSTGSAGANGGNVFVRCMKGASLRPYASKYTSQRIIAEHGDHYQRGKMKMKPAPNSFITVPPGTEIKLNGNSIASLNTDGDLIKVAAGGMGGSSKMPHFNGGKGERHNITLELKIIANAALIGFPNAGKSSTLRVLSRARPNVGHYPFTTIRPMVGSIFYTNGKQVSVADLPGLIEDAHLNKGMGHRFLRHIERTQVIVMAIDVNGFQLKSNHPYRSPLETVILLLNELCLYQKILLERPVCLLVNKMDVPGAEQKMKDFLHELDNLNESHCLLAGRNNIRDILIVTNQLTENNFNKIFPVSAITESGFEPFKQHLYECLLSNETDEVSIDSLEEQFA